MDERIFAHENLLRVDFLSFGARQNVWPSIYKSIRSGGRAHNSKINILDGCCWLLCIEPH